MIALYRSWQTGVLFELLERTNDRCVVVDVLTGTRGTVPLATFNKYLRIEPTLSPTGILRWKD